MISNFKTLSLSVILMALQPILSAALDVPSDPSKEKFQQDIKAAVLDEAITIPQLRELQTNLDTLKAAREARRPDAPVDLLTPYHAMSNIKRVLGNVSPKYRETLQTDLQAVIAAQGSKTALSEPAPSAGEKLGKDIFKAVMAGNPTDKQILQLQDSLNSLLKLKTEHARPLQALFTLKRSKP